MDAHRISKEQIKEVQNIRTQIKEKRMEAAKSSSQEHRKLLPLDRTNHMPMSEAEVTPNLMKLIPQRPPASKVNIAASLPIYVYVYICIYVCMYMYVYVYNIYIYTVYFLTLSPLSRTHFYPLLYICLYMYAC